MSRAGFIWVITACIALYAIGMLTGAYLIQSPWMHP